MGPKPQGKTRRLDLGLGPIYLFILIGRPIYFWPAHINFSQIWPNYNINKATNQWSSLVSQWMNDATNNSKCLFNKKNEWYNMTLSILFVIFFVGLFKIYINYWDDDKYLCIKKIVWVDFGRLWELIVEFRGHEFEFCKP